MQMPSFRSYGEYSSSNYGANSMVFSFPNGLQFFYSYSTLVAFESAFSGLVVQKNSWSTTTGKHLNWIDDGDKKNRVDAETFEKKLSETMSHYGMSDEKCKVKDCGAPLYGRVRVHSHTEDCSRQPHSCADGGCEMSE